MNNSLSAPGEGSLDSETRKVALRGARPGETGKKTTEQSLGVIWGFMDWTGDRQTV